MVSLHVQCAAACGCTCPSRCTLLMRAGGKTDAEGVPVNPVRGGLPMAKDELAAFKLVGAALLMAYVEVRAHLCWQERVVLFLRVL